MTNPRSERAVPSPPVMASGIDHDACRDGCPSLRAGSSPPARIWAHIRHTEYRGSGFIRVHEGVTDREGRSDGCRAARKKIDCILVDRQFGLVSLSNLEAAVIYSGSPIRKDQPHGP